MLIREVALRDSQGCRVERAASISGSWHLGLDAASGRRLRASFCVAVCAWTASHFVSRVRFAALSRAAGRR